MRFFEIIAAGGLELCSAAPEMKDIFIHEKHLLYFKSHAELIEIVRNVIERKIHIQQIKKAGQELVKDGFSLEMGKTAMGSALKIATSHKLGLDVVAGSLSPALVERYLELKERALL